MTSDFLGLKPRRHPEAKPKDLMEPWLFSTRFFASLHSLRMTSDFLVLKLLRHPEVG